MPKPISDRTPPLYLLRKIFQPRDLVILGVLALELVIFAILSPRLSGNNIQFITLASLKDQALAASLIGIAAAGSALVILTGGIDLSVGTTLGLTAVSAALLYSNPALAGYPAWVLALVALGVPLVVGVVNGAVVAYLKIPPFIVTLGMMSVTAGLAMLWTGSKLYPNSQAPFHADVPPLLKAMAWKHPVESNVLSTGLLVMVALALAAAFFLHATPTGRHILAVGGSEEAAQHAGVRVPRIKMLVYVLSALAAGLAGLFHVAIYGGANSGVGRGMELSIIAAVVVGGVSLSGGRGSPLGALAGALIIQILDRGMVFMGYPQANSRIAQGVFIVLAIVVDRLLARFGNSVASRRPGP